MQEYCVDLEIAKELKENGFSQNSEFYWSKGGKNKIPKIYHQSQLGKDKRKYSAPCSDEILKELPPEINGFWLRIEDCRNNYTVGYWEEDRDGDEPRFEHFSDVKLSNALGKLYNHLKEEQYI